MDEKDINCMQLSIEIANQKHTQGLTVGLVVRLYNGEILTATSNESDKSSWFNEIIKKMYDKKITKVLGLYLTINTWSNDGFDLTKLLKIISVKSIYIGLPDPSLTTYIKSDPMLIRNDILRYPDSLQICIIEQNIEAFTKSKQNVHNSPYYSNIRISSLILAKLNDKGIRLCKQEISENKDFEKLTNYVAKKTKMNINKAQMIISKVLAEAFNEKYANYDYTQDSRFLNKDWINNFQKIIKNEIKEEIKKKKVLNLGVGSGKEAIKLFSNFENITFVDIAPDGLKKIKKTMPWVNTIQSRAENLSLFNANSFDVYISLRTYNSSFFDTKLALLEMCRVLKNKGKLILSVANGFLCIDQSVISGLIIPNSEFVDIYRGLNLAKMLMIECRKLGVRFLKLHPTNSEIYLTGQLQKQQK